MTKIEMLARLSKFMFVQRIKGFEPPSKPHFDDEATRRFYEELSRATRYLEFGSGGSTVVADQGNIPTLSVESDRFYATTVRKALRPNSSVEILGLNIGLTWEWGNPVFTNPSERRRRLWRPYIDVPFRKLNSRFPDFILIDGRFRVACALESARRAREAGANATLMFDDYFDRPNYHRVEKWLGAPERVGRAAFFRIGGQEVPSSIVDVAIMDPA